MKIQTTADHWIKGVCLHDIDQAVLNLNISPTNYEQLRSKLAIIKS